MGVSSKKIYRNIDQCNPRMCISNKVKQLDRITSNIFRKYLRPFGITDSQLTIFFVLAKSGGKTQKQLSEIASLEKSTVNRNLQRLIEKGHLTKSDFPIIRITDKGKILLESVIPEWDKAMEEIRSILKSDGEESLNNVYQKLVAKA